MKKYLFIESRDPFESNDCAETFRVISDLAEKGHDVALYLVQNGTFCAREKADIPSFASLTSNKKVDIFADDYSVDERGIQNTECFSSIKITSMEHMSSLLMEDNRVPIWH